MIALLAVIGSAHAADLFVGQGQPYATIADAVRAARDGDRVLVLPGLYLESGIRIQQQEIAIEAALGLGTVEIQLDGGTELFDIKTNGALHVRGLSFDGLDLGRFAVMRSGLLTVDDSSILHVRPPTLGQRGAAIEAFRSIVTLTDSDVAGAVTAYPNGGLVHVDRTPLTVIGGRMGLGFSGSNGAGIYAVGSESPVSIDGTLFTRHTADSGSAIVTNGGDLVVSSATFFDNTTGDATVHCIGGSLCQITGSVFQANRAVTGGAVAVDGTTTTAFSSNILCASPGGGRAVELLGTQATLERNIFTSNQLDDALVRVGSGSVVSVINNHFVGATSSASGGAMRIDAGGEATFVNNLVAYNTGVGAVLDVAGGVLTERYNLFFASVDDHASVPLDATDLVDEDPVIVPPVDGSCEILGLVPDPTSPVIDAGDPAIQDGDGTRSDIGAFGDLEALPDNDLDQDGVPTPYDCDDTNPNIYPGNTEEKCNGIDDDCDPVTRDGVDADGDGYNGCNVDCNDSDPDIHPGATDLPCSGVDEDCDPRTPDGPDADGDGWAECAGDCDDTNPDVNPVASEVSCNGIDDDCDAGTPDDVDRDLDGVSFCSGDCDDRDSSRSPDRVEIGCTGIDEDCDPLTTDDVDADGDGWSGCDVDCNDADPTIYPGAPEVLCSGIDEDCDPTTEDFADADGDGVSSCEDCNDSDPNRSFIEDIYRDRDGDGFGAGNVSRVCGIPNNGSLVDGDCNDQNPSIYPGAEEILYDGIDQDCDGADIDDVDGDGHVGAVDCDDRDPTINPDATDIPGDGLDQDCTGWDAGVQLTGGSGPDCSGCASAPAGGLSMVWVLAAAVARRRRQPSGKQILRLSLPPPVLRQP